MEEPFGSIPAALELRVTVPAVPAQYDARAGGDVPIELSVVMPCLNEAETLGRCIEKATRAFRELGISGEVIIGDNGSTDGSQDIARSHGARVVLVAARGYGNALHGAIVAARGRYLLMGDSDDSYDFSAKSIRPFLEKLREGCALVMGNRFQGGIMPGAMPLKHKYLGNPVYPPSAVCSSNARSATFTADCGPSVRPRTRRWTFRRRAWNSRAR